MPPQQQQLPRRPRLRWRALVAKRWPPRLRRFHLSSQKSFNQVDRLLLLCRDNKLKAGSRSCTSRGGLLDHRKATQNHQHVIFAIQVITVYDFANVVLNILRVTPSPPHFDKCHQPLSLNEVFPSSQHLHVPFWLLLVL